MTQITGAMLISPQEVFNESSVQNTDLGQVARTPDGRCFRYVQAGSTALVAGKLQQAPAIVANHQNIAVAEAASAGATTVTVTLGATAATANAYSNGYLVVNDGDGEGYTYQIKSHPAADASASLEVELYDELEEALTTSSEVCLIPNKYNGVIVNPTTATNVPVGVAVKDITASYYGWIQTKGPVGCLNDSATGVGLGLAPSGSVAGALATVAATTNQVATALQAGVDTEYRTVDLRME
jgi:hypothetical protein